MAENNNIPTRALYCEQCRTAIGPEMDQCPRCGGTNFSSELLRNASPFLDGELGLMGMEMGSDVPIRDVASLGSSS